MRKIFGKQHNVANVDKDLKGQTIVVDAVAVCVERKIAEGGFSNVYLVRCLSASSAGPMALKRQFVNEPRLLEACQREAEIVRTLGRHPNIVTHVASIIRPVGDGIYEYLLLTKYYGRSVFQVMNEHLADRLYLSYKVILKIFCSVCSAVAQLHQYKPPIIHRDLKVENLLLDSDGNCVLCDFGSATTKILNFPAQPISMLQEEVARFTTLSYRSPEMVDLYQGRQITTKSDIWALGVMLYKLCYFTLPFKDSAFAIQNASFAFPSEPAYPSGIKSLISYALNPDSDDRPDIFQLSYVAFVLLGQPCTVQNANNAPIPDVNNLPVGRRSHFNNEANVQINIQSDVSAAASTTVTPRERPKPSHHVDSCKPVSVGSVSSATVEISHTDGALNVGQSAGHKRHTSDPFLLTDGSLNRTSAFRPYRSEKQVSHIGTSESYNPFDIDDVCFGHRFDALPRCRTSTNDIANNAKPWGNFTNGGNVFAEAPFSLQYRLESNVFPTLSQVRQYKKLVNAEDSESLKFKQNNPSGYKSGNNEEEQDEEDSADSVGSAGDLQARMVTTSSCSSEDRDDEDLSLVNDESADFERSTKDDEPSVLGQECGEPEIYGRRPLLSYDSEVDDSEPTDDFNVICGDVFSNAPFASCCSNNNGNHGGRRPLRPQDDWRALINRHEARPTTPTAFVNTSFQEDETSRL